ncbi:hypothetical protein FQN57_005789 [Myotisia sp. PD_48]|nr:hypothetical protein FQN57_005789 [Myotisia sp. PD_48]
MAASLSSPGSSSSFDPYSEDDPDTAVSKNGQPLVPKRNPASNSRLDDKNDYVAPSARASNRHVLPHRSPIGHASDPQGQSSASDNNATRKRKRDLTLGQQLQPKDSKIQYSSEYNGSKFGGDGKSNNLPSSSIDGPKRVKFEAMAEPERTNRLSQSVKMLDKDIPREIIQRICSFLPPVTLGRLLLVDRSFETLLTPRKKELPASQAIPDSLKYLNPGTIWSTSRKHFHPGMPRPLTPFTELEMWRLVRGTNCQFCNKTGSTAAALSDFSPWEGGPGPHGVRIIWPFGVRSCAECLKQKCETEMTLLFSSTLPSLLLPALPFAFFTPSMHYASSISLRGGQPPSGMTLTKYFLRSHVEELKASFEEVKALGSAAAEEWMKGLEGEGKAKLSDAARWEQWELTGGLRGLRVSHVHQASESAMKPEQNKSSPYQSTMAGNNTATLGNHKSSDTNSSTSLGHPEFPYWNRARSTTAKTPYGLPPQSYSNQRNLKQINEAKANRKAEIERRCLEFDPTLTPEVISHMESFIAAIQISHPLTDRDWDVLKPRLLGQREVAEQRERERKAHDAMLQAKSEVRRQQDAQQKEAKELLDKEWEDAQNPIKDRMALYADEIIREGWRNGEGVTREKVTKFAADVLIYVRRRFLQHIAESDAAARQQGKSIEEDPPNGPPKRKIILENMKFIFDTKIKPLTEQFQKELFLCNGCDNNYRYYGFEGVIQHYAAKHTNILSLGSVVVHWRAEWPDRPPFHPDPAAAKALMQPIPRHQMGQGHTSFGGYPVHTMPPDPIGYPQPSPGPYITRTPYGTPYPYGSGPYRPPSPTYYPPQVGFAFTPAQPAYPSASSYDSHPPHPPPNAPYGSPFPGQPYQPPFTAPDLRQQGGPQFNQTYGMPGSGSSGYSSSYPANSHSGRPPAGTHKPNQGSQSYGLYQTHLDDIAKSARNVWQGTSGIKDLPHNVRAHVVIHHVIARFVEKYNQEPALSLFAEALSCHTQMRQIRNLSGLVCKTCSDLSSLRRSRPHESGRGDRKMYTLPALISHFQSMHLESPMSAGDVMHPDWKIHMLLLPDNSIVSSLAHAPGMDQAKFHLITSAFPWVFSPTTAPVVPATNNPAKPTDLKPTGTGEFETRESAIAETTVAFEPQERERRQPLSAHKRQGFEMAVDDLIRFVKSPEGAKRFEPPGEDEYDPHRPAVIDPARDSRGRIESKNPRAHPPTTSNQEHIAGAPGPTSRPRRLDPEQVSSTPHPIESRAPGNSRYHGKQQPAKNGFTDIESSRPDAPLPQIGNKIRSRTVSEDGEVVESHKGQGSKPEAPSPAEQTTVPVRFLSAYGSQEPGEMKTSSRGSNPHLPPETRGKLRQSLTPHREQCPQGSPVEIADMCVLGTPVHASKPSGWAGQTKSPAFGREPRDFDPRVESFEMNSGPPSRRGGEGISPDPTDPRHRRGFVANEPKSAADMRTGRPQSRLGRFDTQRQGNHRPRSRSPKGLAMEYYRNRSPRASHRTRPVYPPYPQEPPYDERVAYDHSAPYPRMAAHPQPQYRYVEEYIDAPYDGPVEYVPVRVAAREAPNPGPYYVDRPVHRGVPPEYVDYDMEYARQPVIEQPAQYYTAGPSGRNNPDIPPNARRTRYRQ